MTLAKLVAFGLASAASGQDTNGLTAFGLVSAALGQDSNGTDPVAGISVKVLGQSGKFTLYSEALGMGDPNKVQVTMDYLHELDASGNILQKEAQGGPFHSINSFANQDFTIDTPQTVTDPYQALKISFETTISDTVGDLKVETFVLSEAQEVGPAGSKWSAAPGDVKWNIEFHNWKWCGDDARDCGGAGAFLELGIEIKGKADQSGDDGETPNVDKADLGGGVQVDLTSIATLDGADGALADGYPKIKKQGGKSLFIFRFPKFLTSAVYDPLIGTSGSESLPDDFGATAAPSAGLLVLAVLASLLF